MSEENIYQAPKSELKDANNTTQQYAGFWIRVGASIIDTILIMMITIPLLFAIYGSNYLDSTQFSQGIWDIIISYIFPAVAVILFWAYKSATPGKMVLGLKIISLGKQETLSKGQLIGRYLGYFVAMIPLFIGIFWVAFDKRKQGWHDKLANTAVVKTR